MLLDLDGTGRQFADLDVQGLPVTVLQARAAHAPASMAQVKALLVRPDAYVAWASDGLARPGEVQAQLARWLKVAA